MIGVRYIQARSMIWYISDSSGKKTAKVDMISVKAANMINTKGINNMLQWKGVFVINIMKKSGTKDKVILTNPVPTEETANDVRGKYILLNNSPPQTVWLIMAVVVCEKKVQAIRPLRI